MKNVAVFRLVMSHVLAVGISSAGRASPAPANWVAATTAMLSPLVSAFASVQSSGLITIAASQSGTVAGLDVQPGQTVTAGQVIAQLSGPQIAAATIRGQAALTAAQAAQRVAAEVLAIERQTLQQQLSTRRTVARATSALAAATAQTATAQASVTMLREAGILRSPLAGVVQGVTVANGDVVTAGRVLATVQPGTGNWLKAVFYGEAVQAGAHGVFQPGTGGNPVKVSLRGALGVSQPDGGMPVALVAAGDLAPGGFGTVTLDLPPQKVTLVPSDALILDKGRWWVMVHTQSDDRPEPVTPGPTRGFDTVIKSGLQPGQDVVVVNAYLLYHRGIAALYQSPD